MEVSPFCRLCSDNIITNGVNIFDEAGKEARVSEIIVQHFGIEIPPNDSYSTSICLSCWSITESFHRLYDIVQLSESNLNTYEVQDDPGMDTMDHYSNHEAEDDIQQSAVVEVQSESVKSELVDGPFDLIDFKIIEISVKKEDAEHDHDQQQQLQPVELVDAEPEEEEAYSDGEPTDGIPGTEQQHRNRSVKTEEEMQEKKERIEMEDQQIRDFFKMNCDMCDLVFHTMNEATLHYRRQHQQAGYLTCCDKKFFRRWMALDHIRQHMNPGALQCEICGRSYNSKFALRTHMLEHDPEPVKPFSCSECGMTFAKQFQLSSHMRLRHTPADKKTFGCDICGKFFVTKHVLSTHIRGVHENAFAHMCHICAKTFKSKQVFELHQREHVDHEIPKLQCNICGAWLKHEHSLRKHMSRHADSEEVCKLCNKVAPNKHALGNHMRYVHSERAYKCTMCEKAFKKPIGLKEHMASHTGVDLYTCPYCPRTFKSGANMHSHRKKKHLEQWTQDRHQRFNTNLIYPSHTP